MVRRRVALAAALLVTVACASGGTSRPRTAPPPPRQASFDEVLAAWNRHAAGLDTLRASGELEVRDLRTGQGRSLGVRLAAGRGGRLYVKGSVAVVTALEIVSDGVRFWFQVPSKKTVWTGRAGGAARPDAGDEQAPYHALRPADLLAALLPEPLRAEGGDVLVLDATRDTFGISLSRPRGGRGTLLRRALLDRQTLTPSGLRVYDEDGELASDVVMGLDEEGQPRSVAITRPREGYFARLVLEDVARNVALPDKAFVPRAPDEWRVVDVDQENR